MATVTIEALKVGDETDDLTAHEPAESLDHFG